MAPEPIPRPDLKSLDADAPQRRVRVQASLPAGSRRGTAATVVSLVVHLLVIYLAVRLTASVVLAEQNPIGDAIALAVGGGGGGGKGGAAFQHAVPPPPPPVAVVPVTPPPVATVAPPPPGPPPAAAAPSAPPLATEGGSGSGTGGGKGSGAGPGTGSGQGAGSGSGTGGGNGQGLASPPVNKQMIVPTIDGVPKELRGKTVEVTFAVGADGIVTKVTVSPPIVNRKFAEKFEETMRAYGWTAGRDAQGHAIAAVSTVAVTFGNK